MKTFGIGLTAFIVVVLVGKLYGILTRPDVPPSVASLLVRYAPGVMIGDDVREARTHLANVRFVSHLGFVGELPPKAGDTGATRTQVRLLLDPSSRRRTARRAEKARVDAVELVLASSASYLGGIYELERAGPPTGTGCIRLETAGNYRDVQYWETPNKRAGIAVITDYPLNADRPHPGLYVSNVIFFRGAFDGGATLRARYEASSCRKLAKAAA